MLSKCVLCFLLAVASSNATAQHSDTTANGSVQPNRYDCRIADVPTVWGFPEPPIAILKSSVKYSPEGVSFSELWFVNRQPTAIEDVALVLEYVDQSGLIIDRFPMVAITEGGRDKFKPPFSFEEGAHWSSPVLPGATGVVNVGNDGVRTGLCPARARVAFLMIRFTNGTVRTLSASGWRVDAVPRFIPAFSDRISESIVQPPREFLVRVRVSVSGKASVAAQQRRVPVWLQDWIEQHWEFHPAVVDGEPTESELTLLFQFYATRAPDFGETEFHPSPLRLIRVLPSKKHPGWDVLYGIAGQYSTIP